MNLIEEVETGADAPGLSVVRMFVRTSPPWPRIRDALGAALEIDKKLRQMQAEFGCYGETTQQKLFREAMNGHNRRD